MKTIKEKFITQQLTLLLITFSALLITASCKRSTELNTTGATAPQNIQIGTLTTTGFNELNLSVIPLQDFSASNQQHINQLNYQLNLDTGFLQISQPGSCTVSLSLSYTELNLIKQSLNAVKLCKHTIPEGYPVPLCEPTISSSLTLTRSGSLTQAITQTQVIIANQCLEIALCDDADSQKVFTLPERYQAFYSCP